MSQEKYIGVKFKAICLGPYIPAPGDRKLIRQLIRAGRAYSALGFIDKNGGNLSVRAKAGMIIKRTGSYPDRFKISDFVLVSRVGQKQVYYFGAKVPSSEARLHFGIYQVRPDINCVLHAHDRAAIKCTQKLANAVCLPEISYGTLQSALAVKKQAKKFDYLIQKNHGVIALGKDVKTAINLLKKYHAQFEKIRKNNA
jgi:L-fuculose-phosphate aldolase